MSLNQTGTRASRTWRIWTDLVVALGAAVVVATYLSIDQTGDRLIIVLCSALAGLAYLCGSALAALVWLCRRRWRRAAASMIKAVAFVVLLGPIVDAGDLIHLAALYSFYRQAIDAQTDKGAPARFFWGERAVWVTEGLQADTLVYDPTGALASTAVKGCNAPRAEIGLATRHLIGHFYIEREFSC